jgi:hypothetical protein
MLQHGMIMLVAAVLVLNVPKSATMVPKAGRALETMLLAVKAFVALDCETPSAQHPRRGGKQQGRGRRGSNQEGNGSGDE